MYYLLLLFIPLNKRGFAKFSILLQTILLILKAKKLIESSRFRDDTAVALKFASYLVSRIQSSAIYFEKYSRNISVRLFFT